ncbi:sensor domain-containing diguanylate cyclase [Caloramator australicus]|uniref:FOG: GGDEF domain n=1 Tax=Caloramator australicus RC3 TaxID=857293 RepID=I7KSX8_9CLOT|nr:sensor domain-containing diguanylate cyclase [Caloramator australicus]CCJ32768.1 FOG: GGDEF domain [Caloramator australicus RC3]
MELLNISLSLLCIILLVRTINLKKQNIKVLKTNETLLKVASELENFESLDSIYPKLLKYTIDLIENAETGSILIYSKDKGVLEYKAAEGFDIEILKKINLKKEELYLYKSTRLTQPAIIKNPRKFDDKNLHKENYKKLLENDCLNISSTLSAPIYVDGEFFGVINVDNTRKEDAFNKNDVKVIKYITTQLEAAIKIAKLMDDLKNILKIDYLTGLYNMRSLEEIIENLLSSRKYFAFCIIDLNDFKGINDTFGHKKGDEVLKYFAAALKRYFSNDSIAFRYAGDEFAIINFKGIDELKEKINIFREYLKSNPIDDITIKFSAGYCDSDMCNCLDDVILKADNDMYKEKRKFKLEVV